VLKVDTDALREAVLIELRDDVRRQLREGRIPYADLAARDGSVAVRIREPKDWERARSGFASLSVATASGEATVDIVDAGEGSIRLTPTEAGVADRVRRARQQSIEVIERRLDSVGVAARGLQPDGPDGIRVLLPGVKDPERLRPIFDKRARITFRLVDLSMASEEALRGNPPAGSEVVYELNTRLPHLLRKQVLLEGDDIVDAAPGFDQRTNEPIVTFRFNSNGTRRFARITEENIGKPFAIVLDDDVLSAPIIREPILGGSGQISGSFTVEDANAIAVLLRSGTLPGRLTVVAQQVHEPEGSAAKQ
jgi:preprotein translocase subunit SecD